MKIATINVVSIVLTKKKHFLIIFFFKNGFNNLVLGSLFFTA